jgi:hypothetical protein
VPSLPGYTHYASENNRLKNFPAVLSLEDDGIFVLGEARAARFFLRH